MTFDRSKCARERDLEQLAGAPEQPQPPPQWDRSYGQLGVVAQRGRLIEVRTPTAEGKGPWPRIYLDAEAAQQLLAWLPQALRYARGEDTRP